MALLLERIAALFLPGRVYYMNIYYEPCNHDKKRDLELNNRPSSNICLYDIVEVVTTTSDKKKISMLEWLSILQGTKK